MEALVLSNDARNVLRHGGATGLRIQTNQPDRQAKFGRVQAMWQRTFTAWIFAAPLGQRLDCDLPRSKSLAERTDTPLSLQLLPPSKCIPSAQGTGT